MDETISETSKGLEKLFYQAVVRSGSTKAIQVEVGPLCCLQRYSDQTSAHRVVA